MNLKDRMKIAEACKAAVCGEVEIQPKGAIGSARYTTVKISWPTLEAMFDIGGSVSPRAIVHFFNAKRELKDHLLFGSVNQFHRHKATAILGDAGQLVDYLREVDGAVMGGGVFA